MKDKIIFGNLESEKIHGFKGAGTEVTAGELEESARIALPTCPVSRFTGEYTFTMKIDPFLQNYISVKMWSGDKYTPVFLYIDGKQLGYAKNGDFEALNLGYGNFTPHRFFYVTGAIPLWFTRGKNELELTLRQAQSYDPICEVNGRMFAAYTHTGAWLDPGDRSYEKKHGSLPHKNYTASDIDVLCENYIKKQKEAFNLSLGKLRAGEKISITKYVESFRQFCMMLFEDYCPAKTDGEKGEAVRLLLNCIDLYVRDYFADVRSLARTSHQSDWGGYYGELGQGLYILEPLLKNDRIFGEEKLAAYLAEPFNCPTEDGEYSLCGKNITRKTAWERCLKANFDFASARQSYIYNQTYYTYEGAWKSMAGLGVIGSRFYIGKEKCDRIMLEALGLAQWRGEHILTAADGRELDLYHCLFNHDKSAVFTEDFLKVVCKGIAVQKTDENGNFVRRKPYGENYFPLTVEAMTRENGYVGNYGETANYMPEWVFRVWNHGDMDLSDKIMKTALKNIHSRSFMRYQTVDAEGNRIMHMEQGTDERNPAMPGKIAYGADIYDGRCFLFASMKRHMEENSERYAAAEWEEYKNYADEAIDFMRQQRLDGRLDERLETLGANFNDFRIDRTIRDILCGEPERVLPHTDFSLYNKGELEVNPDNYTEFAWTDIDNLTVSLRDGDTSVIAQLNLRNRGYCGVGRAHVRRKNNVQLVQFVTDGIFSDGGKYIRPQNVNMDFIFDEEGSNSFLRAPQPLKEFGSTPQALCGEEQPITFQRGIGTVLRENFDVDTPYSGYPDVIWARLGKYFMVFNTTRTSYENEQTFTVRVPESGRLYDMAGKRYIDAENGSITIPPMTAYVFRLSSEETEKEVPSRVNVLNVLADGSGNLIQWKITAGGEKYNLYRDSTLLTATAENIYLDSDVENGRAYTYSVSAVNENGEGNLSCAKTATARKCGCGFVPLSIGGSGGQYEAVGSSVKISSGEGGGFGTGNDYHALERNINDSVCFAAKACGGSVAVSAEISGEGGLMLRENEESNARCCYLGFNADGKIVLHTRSKNTMYKPKGKISPLDFTFEGKGERFLKLLRDDDLQSVAAYSSADGREWRLLTREILPLPGIFYVGAAAMHTAEFSNVEIKKEGLDLPFPIKGVFARRSGEECALEIDKGIDNRTLTIERSKNGGKFETIADGLIASDFTDYSCGKGDVLYRITPRNRHGKAGEAYVVNLMQGADQ